jgi:uncharacterized membrane protein
MSVIALGAGYALLAHYTNITATADTLGISVALAPIALAAVSLAWHSSHRGAMFALLALSGAGVWLAWITLQPHFSVLYWLEHAGTETVLCLAFARSLRPGSEPMCTYFAKIVHGPLAPPLERYTRQVTAAWAIFFGTMGAASTILFYGAPLALWSVFANFFTGPLIALMFIVEYAVRRRLHPGMEHAHILAAVKAFWNVPAR